MKKNTTLTEQEKDNLMNYGLNLIQTLHKDNIEKQEEMIKDLKENFNFFIENEKNNYNEEDGNFRDYLIEVLDSNIRYN